MTVLSATITMVDVPLNFIRQGGIERAAIAQNRWLSAIGIFGTHSGSGFWRAVERNRPKLRRRRNRSWNMGFCITA